MGVYMKSKDISHKFIALSYFLGMPLNLPLLLCVLATALQFSANAERSSDPRYQLGKVLFRRAREINETGQSNGNELEDSDSEMSEEERERVQQLDAAEDIFVGSGNHVYESQGKSETADAKGEETSGDEDVEANEEKEDEKSPASGDGDEGDDDDDEEEKSDDDEEEKIDDDDDDSTEKNNGKKTAEDSSAEENDSSGSGLIESENAASRSMDASGSGSASEEQADISDQSGQSGSGESTIQELAPASTSQDEASGAAKETEAEDASKKSEIEEASSGEGADEDDSGSADVIRKGIESLSRLLTPVASGYDFELYSGKTPKSDKEESEADGESEKGDETDAEETHVKQCKRVCEDPMTYEECAVPRCEYKMGTIKDLCIYLCKHQTPVCRQQCE